MAATVKHKSSADGTFSGTGKTNWEDVHSVSGTAKSALFLDATGNLSTDPLFLFDTANANFVAAFSSFGASSIDQTQSVNIGSANGMSNNNSGGQNMCLGVQQLIEQAFQFMNVGINSDAFGNNSASLSGSISGINVGNSNSITLNGLAGDAAFQLVSILGSQITAQLRTTQSGVTFAGNSYNIADSSLQFRDGHSFYAAGNVSDGIPTGILVDGVGFSMKGYIHKDISLGTVGANDHIWQAVATSFGLTKKFYPAQDTGVLQTSCGIYAGSGVPNNANGANGDYYYRSDGTAAPTTNKDHIYFKAGGAWGGIA